MNQIMGTVLQYVHQTTKGVIQRMFSFNGRKRPLTGPASDSKTRVPFSDIAAILLIT